MLRSVKISDSLKTKNVFYSGLEWSQPESVMHIWKGAGRWWRISDVNTGGNDSTYMVSGHGRKYDSDFGVKNENVNTISQGDYQWKNKKESTIIFTGSCTADYKLFLRGCNAGDGSSEKNS